MKAALFALSFQGPRSGTKATAEHPSLISLLVPLLSSIGGKLSCFPWQKRYQEYWCLECSAAGCQEWRKGLCQAG